MAITINKKFWTEFFDIYRTLPCLWDSKHENYTNRESRFTALYDLVKKMQEIEPNADQDFVRRKINTFRSNFNREVRRIRQMEKERPDEEYNPTLWYFDNLSFLLNQEKCNNNNRSMSVTDETYGGDMTMLNLSSTKYEMLEDSDPLQTPPSSQEVTNHNENSQIFYNTEICRKRRKSETEDENVAEHDPSHNDNTPSIQLNNDLRTTMNCKRQHSSFNKKCRSRIRVQDPYARSYNRDVCSITDEAALFGQTWACEFRKLNAKQKLFAKKAIDEILVLGQLNGLKLQTVPINKTLTEMRDE